MKIDTNALKDTIMNFIVPLVCFGLSVAMVLLVIYPSVQKVPQLKGDLQSKTNLRTQLDTKVASLNKLTDFKSVLEEDLVLLDKVLVSEDNVPYLLNQIDQISRGVGFELTKLNYGVGGGSSESETSDNAAEFIAVNLGVNGTYEQLIRFLQNMEKAARLVNVSNLRFAISSSNITDTKLGLSFLIYSPYLKVNSAATTDDLIQLDIADPSFVNTLNYLKGFTFYENQAPSTTVKVEEKSVEEIETPVIEEDAATFEETTPSAPTTEIPVEPVI